MPNTLYGYTNNGEITFAKPFVNASIRMAKATKNAAPQMVWKFAGGCVGWRLPLSENIKGKAIRPIIKKEKIMPAILNFAMKKPVFSIVKKISCIQRSIVAAAINIIEYFTIFLFFKNNTSKKVMFARQKSY